MADLEMQEALAKALYQQVMTIPNWKAEQEAQKIRWYDQATGIILAVEAAGYQIVKADKPKEVKKATVTSKKRKEILEEETDEDTGA